MPYRAPTLVDEPVVLRLVRSERAARVLARVLVVAFLLIVLALVVVPWQQTAQGYGRVIAYAPLERQQIIEAPIEGRLVRWHVREGSVVKAGDAVVDISDNDPEILRRLQSERDAIADRAESIAGRVESIDARIVSLTSSRRSAIDAADARVTMALNRVAAAAQGLEAALMGERTAGLNRDRQVGLADEGIASTRVKELAELDSVRASTDVERAKATLDAARGEALALRSDRLKIENDQAALLDDARAARAGAQGDLQAARAELLRIEVRLSRQQTQAVVAARDGTVLRLIASQGAEQVKAGDPLAVLVPDTAERAVEIWVDGNDVPLITSDRHVRIQFEGWPAVQFVGWPQVAVGTFPGKVALVDATDDGKGRFRVVVVPEVSPGEDHWPEAVYLRQGVRAQGWVLLSRVRLGYEVWRQFNGFPPMMERGPDKSAQEKSNIKAVK